MNRGIKRWSSARMNERADGRKRKALKRLRRRSRSKELCVLTLSCFCLFVMHLDTGRQTDFSALSTSSSPLRDKRHCLYAESKKKLLQYKSHPAWTKSGGQIPWRVTAIFNTSLTACRTGKHFMNGELVDPFKGPVTPFGSMVEYHPVFAKDQSRLHHTNSARKFYPGVFFGYAL